MCGKQTLVSRTNTAVNNTMRRYSIHAGTVVNLKPRLPDQGKG